jgi:putative endonuclease
VARSGFANAARGRWGEDLAARWYEQAGYSILARNWRCPAGEIDLRACAGRTLVVCEVKTRRANTFGPPAAAVGSAKQQRLRRLAVEWLRSTGSSADVIRFDVVAITGGTVDVIEAAF